MKSVLTKWRIPFLILTVGLMTTVAYGGVIATATLRDGLYTPEITSICRIDLYNDVNTGDLILEAFENCDDVGAVTKFQRTAENQFASYVARRFNSSEVSQCAPIPSDPVPCDTHFYNPETGAFLFQVGDVVVVSQTLTISNSTSFELSADHFTVWRAKTLLAQWTAAATSQNTDDKNIPIPLIYTHSP